MIRRWRPSARIALDSKMKCLLIIFFILFSSSMAFSQTESDRLHLDSLSAAKLIDAIDTKTEGHNLINDDKQLIVGKEKAIALAEFYLFDIYGKKEILLQKPYDIFLIKNRWLISGTLKKGYVGGAFMIIIDAINGSVLQITHGK